MEVVSCVLEHRAKSLSRHRRPAQPEEPDRSRESNLSRQTPKSRRETRGSDAVPWRFGSKFVDRLIGPARYVINPVCLLRHQASLMRKARTEGASLANSFRETFVNR